MYKDEVRPVEAKVCSIKKALKENSSMAKDFYADHILDEVDETYLTNIGIHESIAIKLTLMISRTSYDSWKP